ncbi:hypothetical protein [Luteibacter aegosomatissinici]|uniref:hypothetical protein n=1 Tax=Luteibacter aegosomatissinici TaxID=2911539 RepID=UPI001FF7A3E5|nr:hypothetical protein [Luteibacter aegosomatissinici]UPG96034.1 hypothetical protein L2Y97_07970 [Luteibacter aegosomatissinici]
MSDDDFSSKVRQFARERTSEPAIDWDVRRTWWTSRVDDLFQKIGAWIEPLLSDGTADLQPGMLTLKEDYIGTYPITQGVIRIGGESVQIIPRGTLIVGAAGRVDLKGPVGDAMLLLVQPSTPSTDPQWIHASWYLANAQSRTALAPLDQQVFQNTLLDILGIAT